MGVGGLEIVGLENDMQNLHASTGGDSHKFEMKKVDDDTFLGFLNSKNTSIIMPIPSHSVRPLKGKYSFSSLVLTSFKAV
jgi:hypothetical protein